MGSTAPPPLRAEPAIAAARRSLLLGGLSRLHTLDLTACGWRLRAEDLASIIGSLPRRLGTEEDSRGSEDGGRGETEAEQGRSVARGLRLLLPSWCLDLRPRSDGLRHSSQRPAAVAPESDRFLAAARPLARVAPDLQLLGPGLMVRNDGTLRRAVAQLGQGQTSLTRLHLLDAYPYRGSLSWGLLAGLTHLNLLAVATSTQESVTKASMHLNVVDALLTPPLLMLARILKIKMPRSCFHPLPSQSRSSCKCYPASHNCPRCFSPRPPTMRLETLSWPCLRERPLSRPSRRLASSERALGPREGHVVETLTLKLKLILHASYLSSPP